MSDGVEVSRDGCGVERGGNCVERQKVLRCAYFIGYWPTAVGDNSDVCRFFFSGDGRCSYNRRKTRRPCGARNQSMAGGGSARGGAHRGANCLNGRGAR